jgi:tetratricopeptide (TPR) repeat protein/TolB-like protein
MTDEITGRLSSIDGLTVISNSSARRYAGSEKTLAEIAQELNVTHVVSGSVQWVEADGTARVRIRPELVRVSDQARVWGDTINEQLTDIFEVQGRIAERVAAGLGIELSEDQKLSLEAALTDSPEAYQAFLRGQEEGFTPGEGSYERAIAHYERAVELDPRFAEAWAHLSRTKGTAYRLGQIQGPTLQEQIRSDADRAVALKPSSAEAQVALGYYYYEVRADFERAAEILSLVAERHPNNIESANALGAAYRKLGRLDDSLREFGRSLQLDPEQIPIYSDYGVVFAALGRWDEAAEQYLRAIELEPESSRAYRHMMHLTLARGGTTEEARAYIERSPEAPGVDASMPDWFERNYEAVIEIMEQSPPDPFYTPFKLGSAYRRMGDEASARPHFEQLIEFLTPMVPEEATNETHAAIAFGMSMAHAGLGNVEEAIHFAEMMLTYRPNDQFTRPRNAIAGAAKAFAWVGETERALDTIEEALSTSVGFGEAWKWGVSGPGFRQDPDWDELRGNPRFEALIERLEKEGPLGVSAQSAKSR